MSPCPCPEFPLTLYASLLLSQDSSISSPRSRGKTERHAALGEGKKDNYPACNMLFCPCMLVCVSCPELLSFGRNNTLMMVKWWSVTTAIGVSKSEAEVELSLLLYLLKNKNTNVLRVNKSRWLWHHKFAIRVWRQPGDLFLFDLNWIFLLIFILGRDDKRFLLTLTWRWINCEVVPLPSTQ